MMAVGNLLRAFVCLLFVVGCSGGEGKDALSAPGGPLNAVLISMDTTRADALGCYGRKPAVTPNIDRVASEGIVFERAYTVAPLTLPSHASMLTGLFPVRHSLRENGLWPLPPEADTLAERARAAGFQTAAFVAAVVLDPTFGLSQGFDVYEGPQQPQQSDSSHYTERSGSEVVAGALAWLEKRDPERGFFIWVHLFEPHQPYAPPARHRKGALKQDPYLGEIATLDEHIGTLLDGLERLGLAEESLIALVGDHGESLGEHGELSHAVFCYEAVLRVPWILRFPNGWRRGERCQGIVSVVDVFPTLARGMGLATPDSIDGVDLWREPSSERGVYFESYSGYLSFGMSPLVGWIDRGGKYLHSSAPEFFDPPNDPDEKRNLASDRADELERYRRSIAQVAEASALNPEQAPPIDSELLRGIQGLGYVTTPGVEAQLPPPLAPSKLPAPVDESQNYSDTLIGLAHLNEEHLQQAETILSGVVSRNPDNYVAREKLANCLMRQMRSDEALPHLQRLVQQRPMFAGSHFNYASCLRDADRVEEAIAAYWQAVELEPKFLFMDTLMRYLREQQRPAQEANAFVERYDALRAARLGTRRGSGS
ncbi:MAG: hypothetical protein CMJ89_05355 [Planctomycetes bacterium]|jgi:arylsulfatase A-like enzyme|nr:hypothetical protein [Planctomycetota bacterium]